jgi:glycine/D-amino acid oxidase-like deaminating enzyme/nitrite reductase/ring-hydroxylating ferredoxin subunit
MTPSDRDTTPYWDQDSGPAFAPLAQDLHVDVAIVGGGITGLTTAYLLASAGRRVAVFERGRCAKVDTGHTTAHLTMVTDTSLGDLVDAIGRDHARAVWDAGLAAIAQIDDITRAHAPGAELRWIDAFLCAPFGSTDDDPDTRDRLTREAALADELGFDAEWMASVPLAGRPGVRFGGQARFHPRHYLAGVTRAVVAMGGQIFEDSAAGTFTESPQRVEVNGHTVRFDDLVLATHNPKPGLSGMVSAAMLQTKLALYTSYAVAGRVAPGTVPDALFWDTAEPYHYLRIHREANHDVVIFGGEDHKTGQRENTAAGFERLEQQLRALVPDVQLTHRWSGQVIETPDGLPYIGETAERQYIATGFSGNGMTFGTLAAMIVSDAILGRRNPWTDLFAPGRTALRHGLWDYVKENADYPYYMIRDRFAGHAAKSLRAVPRGEGRIVDHDGKRVAAYRDDRGRMVLRSAICTHLGCTVAWNPAERTWDCPCHGSRFQPTGEVISGPAETPLPDVS